MFALDDPAAAARGLEGVGVLLLAAGPFSLTSAPALDACLRAGAGYVDITGEVEVFESIFSRDEEIRAAVRLLLEVMKIAVEPSGAVGYAAVASGRLSVSGARVGVILSGGNIDLETFARLVSPGPPAKERG